MLKRGATRFDDPLHWPVLGTTGKKAPRLRTVILRRFQATERLLVCYTDARASKVKEIRDSKNVGWLFYHPNKKVQLRITGPAELHKDNPFADDLWATTPITGRLDYCADPSPGTPVDQPSTGLPDFLLKKAPTLLNTEKSFKNFMAISCRIESLDCLKLRATGHLRARFEWQDNRLSSTWLIP